MNRRPLTLRPTLGLPPLEGRARSMSWARGVTACCGNARGWVGRWCPWRGAIMQGLCSRGRSCGSGGGRARGPVCPVAPARAPAGYRGRGRSRARPRIATSRCPRVPPRDAPPASRPWAGGPSRVSPRPALRQSRLGQARQRCWARIAAQTTTRPCSGSPPTRRPHPAAVPCGPARPPPPPRDVAREGRPRPAAPCGIRARPPAPRPGLSGRVRVRRAHVMASRGPRRPGPRPGRVGSRPGVARRRGTPDRPGPRAGPGGRGRARPPALHPQPGLWHWAAPPPRPVAGGAGVTAPARAPAWGKVGRAG